MSKRDRDWRRRRMSAVLLGITIGSLFSVIVALLMHDSEQARWAFTWTLLWLVLWRVESKT